MQFGKRRLDSTRIEAKLFVTRGPIRVKVEINKVIRGTVEPVRKISLAPRARDTLLRDLELPVLSSNDIYGGKFVAALDRQHPRDAFRRVAFICK